MILQALGKIGGDSCVVGIIGTGEDIDIIDFHCVNLNNFLSGRVIPMVIGIVSRPGML